MTLLLEETAGPRTSVRPEPGVTVPPVPPDPPAPPDRPGGWRWVPEAAEATEAAPPVRPWGRFERLLHSYAWARTVGY